MENKVDSFLIWLKMCSCVKIKGEVPLNRNFSELLRSLYRKMFKIWQIFLRGSETTLARTKCCQIDEGKP